MDLLESSIHSHYMTFIKNNYFKLLLAIWLVVGLPYLMYRGYNYNSRSSIEFFENDVIGKIKGIRDGSGGYEIIELHNGKEYRFFSLDFDDRVAVGDSINKPAFRDTITIYTVRKEKLAFTFLKPDDI